MSNDKVFFSTVTRDSTPLLNDLTELLKISPAKPISVLPSGRELICSYKPRDDKYYVPKKKMRMKVRTVRYYRDLYEKDEILDLPHELEKQQNILLRKIKCGSSREKDTKQLARNILKSNKPISRTNWLILMNINPEEHTNPSQYVVVDGRSIRVNGSKGGKDKFLCNFDLGKGPSKLTCVQKLSPQNKKCLLRNSLAVNFKPGPLTKKKYLDKSHQKHVGPVELVSLPKPGLDIQPELGVSLEPSVTSFVHNLRDKDGTISEKWAELSVSTLGSVMNGSVQIQKSDCITFNLDYMYKQSRLLMRNSDIRGISTLNESKCLKVGHEDSLIYAQVKEVVNCLVTSVDISLRQDDMYSGIDDIREKEDTVNTVNTVNNSIPKDKVKKKYGELQRLDVTVIELPDSKKRGSDSVNCHKQHCKLGCICSSLEKPYILKEHCGRLDCMFKCKCDFSQYKIYDTSLGKSRREFIPGLINLNNELNTKLAKEEQKFHQTVVVSDDKSIVLKSQRRTLKASKKYAEFYTSLKLRNELKHSKDCSVVTANLNFTNVEPLCMVHQLYKCFCNGKFMETLNINSLKSERKDVIASVNDIYVEDDGRENILDANICSRVRGSYKRKYSIGYYRETNNKIIEMEQNDKKLQSKLLKLKKKSLNMQETDDIHISEDPKQLPFKETSGQLYFLRQSLLSQLSLIEKTEQKESIKVTKSVADSEVNTLLDSDDQLGPHASSETLVDNIIPPSFGRIPDKVKLVAWLETNYKLYKQRIEDGTVKLCLEAPKQGKVALYPWHFILSRYKERKNYFLISKTPPYRIFMAVDKKHQFFENCIVIDEIRLADLRKYPITVKKLLTDSTDTKDCFYILCGLSFCWELIGSVTKTSNEQSVESCDNKVEGTEVTRTISTVSEESLCIDESNYNTKESENSDRSKWFVMTLENDFTEIRFYQRGFFVKYDSIMKAINVARTSNKTVRLSANKCSSMTSDMQFGLYAIPKLNECTVFIGPYKSNEPLGIETVKKNIPNSYVLNKTRGVWITTKNVDNAKVIDNPLMFLPKPGPKRLLSVDCEKNETSPSAKTITVRKCNTFYPFIKKSMNSVSPDKIQGDVNNKTSSSSIAKIVLTNKDVRIKPIAEIAPNQKPISNPENLIQDKILDNRKSEKGMLILKPEEINKRLENSLQKNSESIETDLADSELSSEMNLDLENFLANSKEQATANSEVLIISDSESESEEELNSRLPWKKVWIECTSVENFGFIEARQNEKHEISFLFPGFKFTEFYDQDTAFSKINQVLARKIYVPKKLVLKWTLVENRNNLKNKRKLQTQDLGSDFILCKKGIKKKRFIIKPKRQLEAFSDDDLSSDLKNETNKFEDEGSSLEEETESLFGKIVSEPSNVLKYLTNATDDQRQNIIDELQIINKMNSD